MWPYWMMFMVPALAAIFSRPKASTITSPRIWTGPWVSIACAITLLVGFRQEVGGDWFTYVSFLDHAAGLSLFDVLTLPDPGYELTNWISSNLDLGIYGTNLFCGAIFGIGLARFCLTTKRPWLALTVAVPYLVIVVAMGYSRQGVALGLAMLGFVALQEKSVWRFALWVVLGATFHKSAVLLLPIAMLAGSKNRYWTILSIALITVLAYVVLLKDSAGDLYANYVESEFQSEGATVRLAMNALPAVILLVSWKKLRLEPLWRWFGIISLGMVGVLYATNASTAVDRMALYLLPLQLVVFAHLPDAGSKSTSRASQMWVLLIVVYYFMVQFVWLNFAVNARLWIPYRFYPLDGGL